MAFKVRFSEERDRISDYDTGDVYEFLEGGVLSIAYAPNKAKNVIAQPDRSRQAVPVAV